MSSKGKLVQEKKLQCLTIPVKKVAQHHANAIKLREVGGLGEARCTVLFYSFGREHGKLLGVNILVAGRA